MPTRKIYKNGKIIGYRWGYGGKIYLISKYGEEKAKAMANKQQRAIYASGYKRTVKRRRVDGYIQRYHIIN